MAVYHILIVHFPIALWMTAYLFIFLRTFSDAEIIVRLQKSIWPLVFLGSLSGAVAFILALQLHFHFDMGFFCFGLMGSSPDGPCDDFGGLDLALGQFCGDTANFLHRPVDQRLRLLSARWFVFGGGAALA